MADVMPDYKVEQQRLIMQLASLRHNLERYRLEVMEMDSRKVKSRGNIEATKKAIKEVEKKLEGLAKAHGAITPWEDN